MVIFLICLYLICIVIQIIELIQNIVNNREGLGYNIQIILLILTVIVLMFANLY